jgi:hypothetical protein
LRIRNTDSDPTKPHAASPIWLHFLPLPFSLLRSAQTAAILGYDNYVFKGIYRGQEDFGNNAIGLPAAYKLIHFSVTQWFDTGSGLDERQFHIEYLGLSRRPDMARSTMVRCPGEASGLESRVAVAAGPNSLPLMLLASRSVGLAVIDKLHGDREFYEP